MHFSTLLQPLRSNQHTFKVDLWCRIAVDMQFHLTLDTHMHCEPTFLVKGNISKHHFYSLTLTCSNGDKKKGAVYGLTPKLSRFHNADGARAEPVITIKTMTTCSLSIFKDVVGSNWALYLSTPQPTLIIHLCSLWKDFSPPIQNSLNPGHGQQMHMRMSANVERAHKLLCYGKN